VTEKNKENITSLYKHEKSKDRPKKKKQGDVISFRRNQFSSSSSSSRSNRDVTSFQSDMGTYGPTNQRTNEPTDQRTNGPTDQRTNGPTDQRTNGPTDQRANGPTNAVSYRGTTLRLKTRCESVHRHRFPMLHLSRRGDKRVEMGHRPKGCRGPLISLHIDVHSVCRATSEGGTDGRTDGMNVHM
jgi:hypothetical protein